MWKKPYNIYYHYRVLFIASRPVWYTRKKQPRPARTTIQLIRWQATKISTTNSNLVSSSQKNSFVKVGITVNERFRIAILNCSYPLRLCLSLECFVQWHRERRTWVNASPWGWKNWPPKPNSHLLFVIGPHNVYKRVPNNTTRMHENPPFWYQK